MLYLMHRKGSSYVQYMLVDFLFSGDCDLAANGGRDAGFRMPWNLAHARCFYSDLNAFLNAANASDPASSIEQLRPSLQSITNLFNHTTLCSDVCELSRNGVCDAECPWGSDCSDCGSVLVPGAWPIGATSGMAPTRGSGRLLPDGIRVECVPLTPETNAAPYPVTQRCSTHPFFAFTKDGRVTLSPNECFCNTMTSLVPHSRSSILREVSVLERHRGQPLRPGQGVPVSVQTPPPAGVIKSIPSGPGTAPLGIRHARSGPATKWDTRTTAAMTQGPRARGRRRGRTRATCRITMLFVIGLRAEASTPRTAIWNTRLRTRRRTLTVNSRSGCSTSPTVNADERCFSDRTN